MEINLITIVGVACAWPLLLGFFKAAWTDIRKWKRSRKERKQVIAIIDFSEHGIILCHEWDQALVSVEEYDNS